LRKFALRLPEAYVIGLDLLVERGFYSDRAEAIRFAVRDLLREELHVRPKKSIARKGAAALKQPLSSRDSLKC